MNTHNIAVELGFWFGYVVTLVRLAVGLLAVALIGFPRLMYHVATNMGKLTSEKGERLGVRYGRHIVLSFVE